MWSQFIKLLTYLLLLVSLAKFISLKEFVASLRSNSALLSMNSCYSGI